VTESFVLRRREINNKVDDLRRAVITATVDPGSKTVFFVIDGDGQFVRTPDCRR